MGPESSTFFIYQHTVINQKPNMMTVCFYVMYLLRVNMHSVIFFFFELVFTPCKAEQPLRGMELQEKEAQKG